jgi:hypothetical protein
VSELLILTGHPGCSSEILAVLCERGYTPLSRRKSAGKFVTEANTIPELLAWVRVLGYWDVYATVVVLNCLNPEKRDHNREIPKEIYDLNMITLTYRLESSKSVAHHLADYLEKSQ